MGYIQSGYITNGEDFVQEKQLGFSVDIDGDVAVAGAPSEYTKFAGNSGVAFVYINSSGSWIQEQKLVPDSRVNGDRFGSSVAIHSGVILVSSNWTEVSPAVFSGRVYVFTKTSGVWTQKSTIESSTPIHNDRYGWGLSYDGEDLIVGARATTVSGQSFAGKIYFYERSGDYNFVNEQTSTRPDELSTNSDQFGQVVSIKNNKAIAGSSSAYINGSGGIGAVWFFAKETGVWSYKMIIHAEAQQQADYFGNSVSIDNGVAAVGARSKRPVGGATDTGTVDVYREDGENNWIFEQEVYPSDGENADYFGYSCSVNGDNLVVGSRYDDDSGNVSGSTYTYKRSNNTWGDEQKLTGLPIYANRWLGESIKTDGQTYIAGGPGSYFAAAVPFDGSGAVYFFSQLPTSTAGMNNFSYGIGDLEARKGQNFDVAITSFHAHKIYQGQYDSNRPFKIYGNSWIQDSNYHIHFYADSERIHRIAHYVSTEASGYNVPIIGSGVGYEMSGSFSYKIVGG